MKNFILILLVLTIMSACSDEFLEENPKGTVSPNNFYNTEEDLISGMYAVYNRLSDVYANTYHVLAEYRGDLTRCLATAAVNAREFPDYFGTSESRYNTFLWEDGYQLIADANAVIDNIEDKTEIEESLKNRVDGEARFFRSLIYYYLVNFFGDVPLIVHQINSLEGAFQERAPEAEVYDQIISDLLIAVQNMPEKSEYSGSDILRPSKGAARMLLAKVYITLKNYSAAKVELQEIISSNEYGLEPNYKDIWKLSNNNLKTPETIMEIYFPSGELNFDQRSVYQQMMLPAYFTRAFENTYASSQLIEKFDTINDLRYTELFVHNSFQGQSFKETDRYLAVYKWYDSDAYGLDVDLRGTYENNWLLFRYADVLLMMTETIAETGGTETEIETYLNMVRNRAGLNDILLAGMSKDEIIQEIFDERARELFMEGHRFIDLKNRGYEFFRKHVEPRLQSTAGLQAFISENDLLLPIPLGEVQSNPLVDQNPGY